MTEHGFNEKFRVLAVNVVACQRLYEPFGDIPEKGEAVVKFVWDGYGDIKLLPVEQPEPVVLAVPTVEEIHERKPRRKTSEDTDS